MPPNADELLAAVAALPVAPVAFEAFWDGDTNGWWLDLFAIVAQEDGYQSVLLCCLQEGGDIRLFNGQVPPWPEAAQAQALGAALATRFGRPFYFPSPDHPQDDCPHWWEQDRGRPCRRCGIPLLKRADHPWPDICTNCYVDEQRERREAAWTPEQRAGPRCHICGDPAPFDSDLHRLCERCQGRYYQYKCRSCGGHVLRLRVNSADDGDLCMYCEVAERLATLPADQREALSAACATSREFDAADAVLELIGGSIDKAFSVVYFFRRERYLEAKKLSRPDDQPQLGAEADD